MGTTIGSPFYMSPEQAQGLLTLDRRADVWAVNALMYEVLTGSLPFSGPTAPAILLGILSDDPVPPSRVVPGLSRMLDAAVARAFDKDPQHRTPTVGALADQLGLAFGLKGTHVDWARTTEGMLEGQVVVAEPTRDHDAAEGLLDHESTGKPSVPARARSSHGWWLLGLLVPLAIVLGYLVVRP
jgi:serine/threonine-protein kinase